jgi:hypothetical protein
VSIARVGVKDRRGTKEAWGLLKRILNKEMAVVELAGIVL